MLEIDPRDAVRLAEKVYAMCVCVPPPSDPLASSVSGNCIVWTRAKNAQGYGRVHLRRGVMYQTHRVTLAALGTDISGKVVDHLCRNRACVNPDHLEAVSPLVNTARGAQPRHTTHERCANCGSSDGFIRVRHGHRDGWKCRPCSNEYLRAYRARRKAGQR